MIIIGYQGIGKSTLASRIKGIIDLESSCMRVDGERPDDWYRYYCNFANHLSRAGNLVFTSSHKVVRDELRTSDEKVFICYPALYLERDWIARLEDRYIQTQLEKDLRAWKNAEECFVDNIKDLQSEDLFKHIVIKTMDYHLKGIIYKETGFC